MRLVFLACAGALLALAPLAGAQGLSGRAPSFPVERGTAPPPPTPSGGGLQTPPPEGVGAAGLDFGAWRGVDPDTYGAAFGARMRARYAGRSVDEARSDLEANGFLCSGAALMQCRLEIQDAQCAKGWYVVFEPDAPAPIAGFDAICPRP